jgi:hypothetical protein
MDTNGGSRRTTPEDVARELLRGSYQAASILAGAVIVQITALAWLMISLGHDTRIDVTTTRRCRDASGSRCSRLRWPWPRPGCCWAVICPR